MSVFLQRAGLLSSGAAGEFVSTWETTNTSTGSSNSDQIALPLRSGGTYNFEVDWGDGSSDTITAWDQAEATHTYAATGQYELRITGTIEGWKFGNGGDRLKLLTFAGDGVVKSTTDGDFWGCANMTSFAGLNTAGNTGLHNTFLDCTSLTSLDVTSFDTSSATRMDSMFRGCSALTSLDVTGFDTSSAAQMDFMFSSCSNLTSVDVTGFNTSSAATMNGMFRNCSGMAGAFDPSGFNVTALTDATSMMDGTSLTTAVYDALLVNWEVQAVNNSVPFHAGTSTYTGGSAAATARQALIDDHVWTITDGGTA